MDPRKPEIRDMQGCSKPAAIVGFIAGVFVLAIVVLGIIEITGMQSYSDTTAVPAVYPSAVK